jgi:hypothetical protein
VQIIAIKLLVWMASWVSDLDRASWDDQLIGGLNFLSNSILQVPFLLMTLMRYMTPTLDDMYGSSLIKNLYLVLILEDS